MSNNLPSSPQRSLFGELEHYHPQTTTADLPARAQTPRQQQGAFYGPFDTVDHKDGPSSQGGAAPPPVSPGTLQQSSLKMIDPNATAVLDACILDLSRRRIAMAQQAAAASAAAAIGLPNTSALNQAALGMNYDGLGVSGVASSTSTRSNPGSQQERRSQEQHQNQQFRPQQQQWDDSLQQNHQEQFLPQEQTQQRTLLEPPIDHGPQEGLAPNNSGSGSRGGSRRQWWVCRVCQNKAFASHDEATEHEAMCDYRDNEASQQVSLTPQQHRQKLQLSLPTDPAMQFSISPRTPLQQEAPPQPDRLVMHQQATLHPYQQTHQPRSEPQGYREGELPPPPPIAPPTDSFVEGSYTSLHQPMHLSMKEDKDWLTPLHCFVRRHCVEVFTATPTDVATPSKGKRKPIQVGQVGIRCPHCHPSKFGQDAASMGVSHHHRERGSVYYPTTISSIYNATMNLLQRHLHSCPLVPREIMSRYSELKADDARSGTSKKYWVDSAKSLGLVDTPYGIRFSSLRPPPLPTMSRQQISTGVGAYGRRNSNDFFSSKSNAMLHPSEASPSYMTDMNEKFNTCRQAPVGPGDPPTKPQRQAGALTQAAPPLVIPADKASATAFSYHLLAQMQPCVFTEADRLGKRKGLPAGFAGLACRHCFGGYGSGRFFPSSIKTLSDTSKTLNVLHNHMMRCRKCPSHVRETLEKLRLHHDEERAKMKFGSQKAFFAKIWSRLHDGPTAAPRKSYQRSVPGGSAADAFMPTQAAASHQEMMMSAPQMMRTKRENPFSMASLDFLSQQGTHSEVTSQAPKRFRASGA